MRIEKRQNIEIYNGKILAELTQTLPNPIVQQLLLQIKTGTIESLKNSEELNSFSTGMIKSFEKSGYIDSSGTLTPLGVDITSSGKVPKRLKSLFDVLFLNKDGVNYLIKCSIPASSEAQKELRNAVLPGRFADKRFKTEGSTSLEIQDIRMTDSNFLLQEKSSIELKSVYDFQKNTCNNKFSYKNDSFEFFTSDENVFYILNSRAAKSVLRECLEEASGNAFLIDDGAVILTSFNEAQKKLIWRYLKDIFQRHEFDFVKDEFEIHEIKLQLDNRAKYEVLMSYLIEEAERKYLGLDEISRLIRKFPECFEKCDPIEETTVSIFKTLCENASKKDKKAYLHLRAFSDLNPNIIEHTYEYKKPIDYSTQTISWQDFVSDILQSESNIKSVTTLSKYVSINEYIALGLSFISECLKSNYGIKLNVITSYFENQRNRYWNRLNQNVNLINKNKDDIKGVHDRYWKIVRNDNSEFWFKTTTEVDAIKYTDPNTADYKTKGQVKELTIMYVSPEGIREEIKKLFN